LAFDLISKASTKPEDCVLMVVDVQRHFCDPSYRDKYGEPRGSDHTDEVAKSIAKAIPQFRQLGVDVSWIYSHEYSFWPRSSLKSFGGFHLAEPDRKKDQFFAKYDDSIFQPTGLISHFMWANGLPAPKTAFEKYLRQQNKKTVITCGFNLSACVRSSARDALSNGFNVIALEDLCANDNENPSTENGWFDFRERMARYKVEYNPFKPRTERGDYDIQPSSLVLSKLRQLKR
jgi:nicotinamidase-related amidase